MTKRCIIIGAGHAAAQLSVSLRQQGWQGEIIVIGDEPSLPYHRPPLSKAVLAGEKEIRDILIRPQAAYQQSAIEFRLGARVTAIHRSRKTVSLDTGAEVAYDKLALVTGATVRKITLLGVDNPGVYYLRNAADVEQIRPHIRAGKRAVIIGGGYIGLETAAVLRQRQMQVTVLEALPRVLQRVTAPEISAFYTRVHREEGVTIVTDAVVDALTGESQISGVIGKDGSHYPADLVIIGIGVLPATELAEAAGLDVDNGIVVNAYAQTSDPDIVAAGDCANHYSPIYQRRIRLESVQNATDQAKVAAATLCGNAQPYNALPWFWSDQYDLKLQIAGLSQGFDQVVIRGDCENSRSVAAFYLRQGKLLAVDAVNRPQDFLLSKRLITSGAVLDAAILADEDVSLKTLLDN